MTAPQDLPEEDRDFIVKKAVDGYEPELITYIMETDTDSKLTGETVENFINSDYGAERIELERRVQEKKSDVTREELIRDLKEQKSILMERSQQLRDNNLDEINNETVNTILKSVRMLGEFIDELQSKDSMAPGVVSINKLEQNIDFSQTLQYLPKEDKKDLVEQLENDPDVEDFAIMKRKETA